MNKGKDVKIITFIRSQIDQIGKNSLVSHNSFSPYSTGERGIAIPTPATKASCLMGESSGNSYWLCTP
jgi:hypothetical protein